MDDKLISRKELWRKFAINPNTGERYRTKDCDNFYIEVHLEAVLREIMSAPTVDPVKHGKWIWTDDGYLRCSECTQKAPVMTQYQDEPIPTATYYCPHCGAKMDVL